MRKNLKKIFKITHEPYMSILPGNVAFSFMTALIPILSIIVSILHILNLSFPQMSDQLSNIIPAAVLDIVFTFLNGSGWNNALFLILGFYSASAGMTALITASNVIYGDSKSTYLEQKIKSLILIFLVILIIIINLGILVFGDTVLRFIIKIFGLNYGLLSLFSLLKWPFALVIIYYIVKIIYVTLPDHKVESKYMTKGALTTTLLWILSSSIYSFFVSNINFVDRYGSFANIIILLIWLYIISYVLVLGIAINVNDYKNNSK